MVAKKKMYGAEELQAMTLRELIEHAFGSGNIRNDGADRARDSQPEDDDE